MNPPPDLPPELLAVFEELIEVTDKLIRDAERSFKKEERRKRDLRELQKVTIPETPSMTTNRYEQLARLEAIYKRENRHLQQVNDQLRAANARLRTDLAGALDLDPLHQATIRDVIKVTQHLHTLADPTPTQQWGGGSRAADPPLPHEPTEWARYGLELYHWRLRGETQRVLSHHPLGDGSITTPGQRPTPPQRRDTDD